MDTRLLRTFLTLARTGSFTAAAAELHLAQSTVTVQIRALERELRTQLFDRLPAGTVLTDSGQRLREPAEAMLDAEASLRVLASGTNGPADGLVTIGATESLCAYRMPALIGELRRTQPLIQLRLLPATTASAIGHLGARTLDIALVLEPELAHADLAITRIGHEPLTIVAGPGHPLAGTPATWQQLAAERFFLLEDGCSHSDELARRLCSVPGARPDITRFASIEAVRSCVAAGLGLAQLPASAVTEHLATGRLAKVSGPPRPAMPVLLLRHRRRWQAPPVKAVIAELTHGTAFRP